MKQLTPIEKLAKQAGIEIRSPEIYYTEYVASPKSIEALRQAIISDFVSKIEPVGWTNEDQISYIENDGQMLVYPDNFECPIPIYDLSEWKDK